MIDRNDTPRGHEGRRKIAAITAGCFALAVTVGLLAVAPSHAASIPAWLDDAITIFNERNPETRIWFVDIKDSFVWYRIPNEPDIGSHDIRERVYTIVAENGYKRTDDEELITTARPPEPTAPGREKKCWRRSFVLDIEQLSNTTSSGGYGGTNSARPGQRQRMLTSMVCEDGENWFAGFRVLQ